VFQAEIALELVLALESAVCVGWVEQHLLVRVSSLSPDCLRCLLARKASRSVVFTKRCRVSFYLTLPLVIYRKGNTTLLHYMLLGARLLDQIMRFPYCGVLILSIGCFGHVKGEAHVGLFHLYIISFPAHHMRHVEYLQAISCCFKPCDVAFTSTIYALVAST
jgi:hypothetical protein